MNPKTIVTAKSAKTSRTRVIETSLAIAFFLWTGAALLSYIAFLIVTHLGNSISYSASALGQFSGNALAATGVVIAVLIGVFTSINTLGRNNRNTGFQTLLQSVGNVENLNLQLKTQCSTLADLFYGQLRPGQVIDPPEKLVLLNAWIQDIDNLTDRLNRVPMAWRGWGSDIYLENELVDHVNLAQAVSENIEDQKQEILTLYKQNIRNILVGLRLLDEAFLSDVLLLRLAAVLGSLAILMGFGSGLRLAADIDVGFINTSGTILFYACFLGSTVFSHLLALVLFLAKWWDNVRRRDQVFIS